MKTKSTFPAVGIFLFGVLLTFQNCGEFSSGLVPGEESNTTDLSAINRDSGGPTAPSGLMATVVTGSWVEVHWKAAAANEGQISAYRIYRDNNIVGTVDMNYDGQNNELKRYAQTLTFIDCNSNYLGNCEEIRPARGQSHTYFVTAVDEQGRQSASSEPIQIFTPDTLGSSVKDSPTTNPDYELVFAEEFDNVDPAGLSQRWHFRRLWDAESSWVGTPPYDVAPEAQQQINGEIGYGVDLSKAEQTDLVNPFQSIAQGLRIHAAPNERLSAPGFTKFFSEEEQTTVSSETSQLPYTTGFLRSKQNFTYGYVEARIKVAGIHGFLSTIFLLNATYGIEGDLQFGQSEIDIMEYLGGSETLYGRFPDRGRWIYQNYHFYSKFDDLLALHKMPGSHAEQPGSVHWSEDYHIYSVLWEQEQAIYYIDGVEVFRATGPAVSNDPKYIELSLVVGGEWATEPFANATANLDIDYIRVYQTANPGGPGENPDPDPDFESIPIGVLYRLSNESAVLTKVNATTVCNKDSEIRDVRQNTEIFNILKNYGDQQSGGIGKCSQNGETDPTPVTGFESIPIGVQYRLSNESAVLTKINATTVCNVDFGPTNVKQIASIFNILKAYGDQQSGGLQKCSVIESTEPDPNPINSVFNSIGIGVQYRLSNDGAILKKLNATTVCNVDTGSRNVLQQAEQFNALKAYGDQQSGGIRKCSSF